MADIDNSELDSAKRWWKKNAGPATAGVLLAVIVLVGWYGWQWYSNRQDAHAADMYAQVETGIQAGNVTGGLVNVVDTLENDYDGTPYAGAAAMALAAYYVDQNQLDKAAPRLAWASKNAQGAGMQAIATARRARLLWAQNKPDAALAQLDSAHPPAFDALFAELTGDIQRDRGNTQAAHTAYQRALAHLPDNVPRQPLTEKLQATASANANGDPATTHHNAKQSS